MSDAIVHLSFPAKADYLLLARLTLSGLARDAPINDELLADLKLAVTEACGNAVRHAYPDSSGEVSVSYVVSDATVVMIVEDQGEGIRPGRPDDAESAALEGGMGMSIIKAIVDEVDVHAGADGRGTVVHMMKRLNLKPVDGT
jgi:serine/threonine-protein kinase RsbW